jgi:hypothetical protein
VVEQVGSADYYDVICEDGRIVLTPVHPGAAAAVRSRLAELGIAATSGNSSLKSGADVRSPAGACFEGFRIDDGDCWAGQKPWRSTPKQS